MECRDKEQIVEEIAKAWETLDADLIIQNIDESFVYNSQWVFESLDYAGYKEYIRGKFQTLKNKKVGPNVKIVPDNFEGGTMIALQQGNNEPCFFRIKVLNGKVIKGDLCAF